MSDELRPSDEEVRRATAAAGSVAERLEGETAALREGFLELGKRLETAASKANDELLIERLRCGAGEEHCEPARAARNAWTDRLPLVLGGALALTIALVTVRIVQQWPQETGAAAVVEPTTTARGHQENEIAPPAAPHKAEALTRSSSAAAMLPSALHWQDSLDYEIAWAEAGVRQMRNQGGLDGSLNDMNARLEALSRELRGGQL